MNDLINKFLTNQLTAKEAATLLELPQDTTISEEFHTTAMIRDIFTKSEENTFRDILTEIEFEEKNRPHFSKEVLQSYFVPIEEYENN